jgi:UDP-3-O-[3-hydroxymyristoyl] N-acetylglucosamine deacetylase
MSLQQTIGRSIGCRGVGLHSGETAEMTLHPAPAGAGVVFIRPSPAGPVRVQVDGRKVVSTNLSTTLGDNGTRVHTVEHLLAALAGLEIDNVIVELDSSEVPILDGSAGPFVDLILTAGITRLSQERRVMKIVRPIVVTEDDREVAVYPCDRFEVDYTIRFDHPLLAHQRYHYQAGPQRFVTEIARARTFCFLREVEAMRAGGLAKGGSLENAVVIGERGVLNPDGLRFPDEFVRHKVLDIIGDLSLLGYALEARVEARCSGHRMNSKLVQAILGASDCWELTPASARLTREATVAVAPAV